MKLVFLISAVLAVAPTLSFGKNDSFESPSRQAHLLELFSTQSCSSCPPAQRWVSGLKEEKTLWKNFVPVVYHVDYWDYLGWKDPYSQKSYTRRQHGYAQQWKSSRVYTPMFVLDGKEWRDRSTTKLNEVGSDSGVLKADRGKGLQFTVTFRPSRNRKDRLIVFAALLGNEIATNVTSGENGGKVLKHDFLSLDLQQSNAVEKNGVYQASFDFKTAPKEVTNLGASFWITTSNGTVLQAVGGNLSKGE
ncbi:MAG: DUF1223 domain-containing protein [Bdellovibrionaceae bacterium]|nr:DUF1223 domain-containing protein [Bdellovibrionales bacterium]MCB9253227.1 DUF1223 domain-containing protein [Pseudobdellovibrionaceae bacterium]